MARHIPRHSQIVMTTDVCAETSEEAVRAAIGRPADAMSRTGRQQSARLPHFAAACPNARGPGLVIR
ncbi:hypothetical protein ACWGH4_15110, partial [Streptomyces sp. NPDC054847]